jgi:hypothetical protein
MLKELRRNKLVKGILKRAEKESGVHSAKK